MGVTERHNSFKKAYEYLRLNGLVSSQRELAEKMHSTAPNVSKALSGDEKTLTEKYMSRLNLAFGNIFRTPWLLDGEGEMLVEKIHRNIITFEYNEHEGMFHENLGDSEENTNGYRTICKTTYQIWDIFRNRLRVIQNTGHRLTYNEIIDLWNNYTSSLYEDEDECMSSSQNTENSINNEVLENNIDYSLVPLINIDSVGGMDSHNAITSGEQYIERMIPFTGAKPGDRAIYQSGDSMTPTIPPGSIMQIRKVEDWQEYFGYGGTFVLWLRDERRITKQILKYKPDPQNYVTCHSFNPDSADEELPKKFIREVWKVIKVLTDKGW